jgi:hypothetical protein
LPEFDKSAAELILFGMSIQAADLRKLVKIVRQYEVIYGGGISSGDAAIREECDGLVGLLESELGDKKAGRRGARGEGPRPSLIDARKKPKESGAARPMTSRASELATLTSPKPAAKQAAPASKAGAKPGKASVAKAPAKGKAPPAKPPAAGKGGKKAEPKGKAPSSRSKPAVPEKKASRPEPAAAPVAQHPVYQDVRSRHEGGAKAAAERANRIAGHADDSGEAETKKHFAALHLFDAFQKNRLPKYGGFIVCVRFADDKGYTIIEIIGYENMQDLYPEGDTLVFKSVGCKLYAVVEPSGYLFKSVEPVNRPSDQMIPYRFSELLRITTKRFQGILIGRKPVFMPTSFSVFKPAGEDLAVLFYNIADVYSNIQDFLIMILRDRLGLPVVDSRKAAEVIARGIREFRLWMDEA